MADAPAPAPSPAPSPDCGDSDLCQQIFNWTGQGWLAESSYVVLVKPVRILVIILLAMLLRFVLRRMINRLVQSSANGSVPTLLRPLRERMPQALTEATALFSERRRQRAEAIGSLLASMVTAVVFSIAALLVLAEFSINLGPLIASMGILGVALGFGAQTLVKDLIAGLFMLLEDQYGVGDVVDVGEASGVVEAVGLRTTTIRDVRGVLWYVRNGEIIRVGNRSQGWAMVVIDVPIGFAGVDEVTTVLRQAAEALAEDPAYADDLTEPPQVLGVEQITAEGAVIRTTAKTTAEAQWRLGRELRRRLTEALESSGHAAQIAAARMYLRPPMPKVEDGQAGEVPPGPATPPL